MYQKNDPSYRHTCGETAYETETRRTTIIVILAFLIVISLILFILVGIILIGAS